MSGLLEFLRARLDEDEATARRTLGILDMAELGPGGSMLHPRRQLAEVGAKRRIVELHGDFNHGCCTYDHNGDIDNCTWVMDVEDCSTVRLLALPYADHPDYREEWKP